MSAVAAVLGLAPRAARADGGGETEARQAYDRGAAAYDSGDWRRAALHFSRADELVPNLTVLRMALTASLRADDAVTGMTLVERAKRRLGEGSPLASSIKSASDAFAKRVGRVVVRCPPPLFCSASVDGTLWPIDTARYANVGDHAVVITVDGVPESHSVRVEAGADAEIAPDPRAQAAPSPAPSPAPLAAAPMPPPPATAPANAATDRTPAVPPAKSGLAPTWFWIGAGASAVLGGVTIWSALDTASKHDAFVATRSASTQSAGIAAQDRTTALLVTTGVLAAATASIGIFAVRWQDLNAEVRAAGPSLHLVARF